MKMITKAIEKKIPALYATDGKPATEKKIAVKFFNPCGAHTWYAIEGEKQENGDWVFFGYVDFQNGTPELGYFSLNELMSVRLPFGLKIERDIRFNDYTLQDVLDGNC